MDGGADTVASFVVKPRPPAQKRPKGTGTCTRCASEVPRTALTATPRLGIMCARCVDTAGARCWVRSEGSAAPPAQSTPSQ